MQNKRRNSQAWQRFRKNKRARFAIVFLAIEVIACFLFPLFLDSLNPNKSDPEIITWSEPSAQHILGTDKIGRDLFARLLYGGRVSLTVGILSTCISVALGVPLGLIAGYYRGIPEAVIMRVADVFMSFPSMILILVLVAVIGPSIVTLILVIGVMGWTGIAKLIYGNVLSIRQKEYIESSKCIGRNTAAILFKEILPNAMGPVWVTLSFRVGGAILQESGLSFLGVGVQTPQASWGNLINAAQDLPTLMLRPWAWVPAGVLIVLTTLSFNFLGEGVRDALDPKMKL
ncbi:MAG: ABC transporter permease [Firmicutes bacterium]|nr:ABC transporter permease [Bacillota bacterium]